MDSAFRVHSALGPGLLESIYQSCLAIEIRRAGLECELEVPQLVYYRDEKVADIGFRIDLLVQRELVIEVKAKDSIHPVDFAQTLSYLRLSRKRLGLLINFHVPLLKDGIRRIANNF